MVANLLDDMIVGILSERKINMSLIWKLYSELHFAIPHFASGGMTNIECFRRSLTQMAAALGTSLQHYIADTQYA